MKKQTKTYLLLALVLFVWGAIAYQIIGGLGTANTTDVSSTTTSFTPKVAKEREVFTITANYRDPFFGTVPTPKKKTTARKPAPPKEIVPEVHIAYTGYITDTETKEKIFFITLDGNQLTLTTKEKVGDLTLLSGSTSSIRVRYKNKTRTIALQE